MKPEHESEGMPEEPSVWYPYHPESDPFVLKSDYDALRKETADAARYRWIRYHFAHSEGNRLFELMGLRRNASWDIDAAIDAHYKNNPMNEESR